ncbi:MAG: MFS transporter [Planctomycetota bacterium]
MSQATASAGSPANGNEFRLFLASFLTLIAAGVGFSVRGAILGNWSSQFGFTQGELGAITGGGLVGFGLTIIFFSFFADLVGYGPLMAIAWLLHVASVVVTLAAGPVYQSLGKDATFQCLYWGAFLFALGNGTCEAVINPLTATLYPNNKTHWLNILHAGWPGGLILGALLGLLFNKLKLSWEIQIGSYLVPTILYGVMMVGQRFPKSEARVAGVSLSSMLREVGLFGALVVVALLGFWLWDLLPGYGLPNWTGIAVAAVLLGIFGACTGFSPGHWMFAMLLVLHALVGYVELGTDSWITNITGTILSSKDLGLWLFIWTSGLMFVLRFFAGPIVHKISPLGLLFISSVLGAIGLFMLGNATSGIICVVAATVYGFGKTFLWPTMLGVASERFPRGGAMALGALGGVGMLSAGLLGGPGIGYKQDYYATTKLEQEAPETFARYKAGSGKGFLWFPEVSGLDGAKVANLLVDEGKSPGDPLQADIAALEKSGRKLEDVKELSGLKEWFEKEAQPNLVTDAPVVTAGRLYGSKQALIVTALVPATMAVGYLLLILYFKARGGYKTEHIDGQAGH